MRLTPITGGTILRRRLFGALLATALAVGGSPSPAVGAGPLVATTPVPSVSFDGLVYTSTYVGTTLYVGGSFRNALVNGKPVVRKRLAALDARTGKLLPWAPVADATVFAMAAAGSTLYVAGKFKTVGGQPRPGLAAVNVKTGAVGPLKHTVQGETSALAVGGGRLYLGGAVTAVDGRAVKNLAAFRLSDGALDTAFRGSADKQVKALAVAGTRLYVGGAYRNLNGAGVARLAALRLADGQLDKTFRSATPYDVFALSVTKQRVYAGMAGPGGRVAAYRPDGGLLWSTVTDGDVQALTQLKGTIYAGGHFTVACPKRSTSATAWCPATMRSQPRFAALNPSDGSLLSWKPSSDGKWGVLTMSANVTLRTVAAGGDFTKIGGLGRARLVQFQIRGYGSGGRATPARTH